MLTSKPACLQQLELHGEYTQALGYFQQSLSMSGEECKPWVRGRWTHSNPCTGSCWVVSDVGVRTLSTPCYICMLASCKKLHMQVEVFHLLVPQQTKRFLSGLQLSSCAFLQAQVASRMLQRRQPAMRASRGARSIWVTCGRGALWPCSLAARRSAASVPRFWRAWGSSRWGCVALRSSAQELMEQWGHKPS